MTKIIIYGNIFNTRGGFTAFENKRKLKQIAEARYQLENEKQELLFIKEQLEDSTPKIDVSNVYIWKDKKLSSIVRLDIEKIRISYLPMTSLGIDGYRSTLTDIFSNALIYKKESTDIINKKESIDSEDFFGRSYNAFLLPLHEVDRNLLAYANKKVPLYVLQQLYYKLNKVNANAYTLKKQK